VDTDAVSFPCCRPLRTAAGGVGALAVLAVLAVLAALAVLTGTYHSTGPYQL